MRTDSINISIPETARLGIVCEGRDEEIYLSAFFEANMKDAYAAGHIYTSER